MPDYEAERLSALRQLNLLDTPASESFDRITRMASQLFDLPISAVSLTDRDRQWFKSRVGVEHASIPRSKAPCARVADSTELLVIPDLLADEHYKDSVLAQSGIRFYAGAPLTTRHGFGLGAMCVLGVEPRQASSAEMSALSDLAAMVMAQIELQHAFGRVDPLSGLPNRNQFIEDMEDLARERPAQERRFSVLLDLARPQEVEDAVRTVGPGYVDAMVRRAAAFLQETWPELSIYHVGQTQFAFLADPEAEETTLVAHLAAHLQRFQAVAPAEMRTNSSIGLAPFRWRDLEPANLLRTIHSAAQDARDSEQGVGVYSSVQDEAHARRFSLLSDFGSAMDADDQLRLVYQPRIDIASGRCVGVEALLRWNHPALGEISPGEFVPLIERTGLARPMTTWVLKAALRQLSFWQVEEPSFQMSVNISASNLQDADFAGRVASMVHEARIDPATLELEVTEGAMMQGASAIEQLQTLAAGGIQLAIDDFGTGYSNFAYLQSLPVNVVKIDQSFVRDIVHDSVRRTLVATMANLSHALGYRVVGEGVETAEAFAVLAEVGCDEAQGYHFGRPMAPQDLALWRNAFKLSADPAGRGEATEGVEANDEPGPQRSQAIEPFFYNGLTGAPSTRC